MVYSHTHTIHVWYIYLHLVDVYGKYVGRYTIHGSYGIFFENLATYPGLETMIIFWDVSFPSQQWEMKVLFAAHPRVV